MFSIHVPGDLNHISYLIGQYQDMKQKSKFYMDLIKQNQVDDQKDNIYYEKDPNKAMIPFSDQLEDDRN